MFIRNSKYLFVQFRNRLLRKYYIHVHTYVYRNDNVFVRNNLQINGFLKTFHVKLVVLSDFLFIYLCLF